MLSGEGNAGERRKTTTSLISKKSNFARAADFFCTFLCLCFARLQTTLNFQKLLSYTFKRGNVERVLVDFFFTARAHFHLALVTAIISYFVTTATKFSRCSSNKNVSFVFYLSLQISVVLFLVELRWPAAYFLFFSIFLLLYIPNLWT